MCKCCTKNKNFYEKRKIPIKDSKNCKILYNHGIITRKNKLSTPKTTHTLHYSSNLRQNNKIIFKKSFELFTYKIFNRFFVYAAPKKRKNSDEKKKEETQSNPNTEQTKKHRYEPDPQQPADESGPSTSTTFTVPQEYQQYYMSKDFKPFSSATPSNPPVTVKPQTQKRKSKSATPRTTRKHAKISPKQETSQITQTLPTTTSTYSLFTAIKTKYSTNQYFQQLSNINTTDISSGITIDGINYSIEFKEDLNELFNNTIVIYHTLDFQIKTAESVFINQEHKNISKEEFLESIEKKYFGDINKINNYLDYQNNTTILFNNSTIECISTNEKDDDIILIMYKSHPIKNDITLINKLILLLIAIDYHMDRNTYLYNFSLFNYTEYNEQTKIIMNIETIDQSDTFPITVDKINNENYFLWDKKMENISDYLFNLSNIVRYYSLKEFDEIMDITDFISKEESFYEETPPEIINIFRSLRKSETDSLKETIEILKGNKKLTNKQKDECKKYCTIKKNQ